MRTNSVSEILTKLKKKKVFLILPSTQLISLSKLCNILKTTVQFPKFRTLLALQFFNDLYSMHSVPDRRKKTAFRKSWICCHNNCISKDFGAQTKYMKQRNIHYSLKKHKGKDQCLLNEEGQNRQNVEGIHCQD